MDPLFTTIMDVHNCIVNIHNLRQLWMSIIALLLNIKVEQYGVPKGPKPHNYGAP